MKDARDSALYQSADQAVKVTSYAEEHSSALPANIVAYRERMASHEWADMLTSDFQSQFHILLAQSINAKRVLEIGVFLGYSALVWSHAVGPEGTVTGLEYDADFADQARKSLQAEGVNNVDILVGPAAETLPTLKPDAPYDVVFIDADKPGYKGYLEQMLAASQPGSAQRLLRPGALILSDNVLQRGKAVYESENETISGVREFNDFARSHKRLQTVLVPLWDGLSFIRVVD